MYEVMPKKLLVINILDILNKYSDVEHRLKQKDFIDILRKEYGMDIVDDDLSKNYTNYIQNSLLKIQENKNSSSSSSK